MSGFAHTVVPGAVGCHTSSGRASRETAKVPCALRQRTLSSSVGPLRLTASSPVDRRNSTRLHAFWFWNKEEAKDVSGATSTAAPTTTKPVGGASERNNVSPASGFFEKKGDTKSQTDGNGNTTSKSSPVVDDWQRLTSVSFYPNATSKFQPTRWHVKKRLGQGSYGVVYLAEDLRKGSMHALKVLSKTRHRVDPARVMWKLQNEIQLLGSVQSCPNVVRFHEVMEDDDRMYLVMDVCQGGTLQDLVDKRRGALLEAEAALAMADVLYFLTVCHRNQICYADVKPANFMFAQPYEGLEMYRPAIVPQIDGVVNPMRAYSGNVLGLGLKAIDMGCSKVVRAGTALTKRMGTPAYFAPEVFQRSYTPKADLWSAGVLAHQLLIGRFPFWKDLRGLSTEDVAECVIHRTVQYPEAHWSKTPSDARDFTTSLLQKDPNMRITAEEALQHPWIQRHLKSVRAAHRYQ